MARTNKYSSINFNDIYDKKINTKSSSSESSSPSISQKSHQNLTTSRTHGGMLVLTRPTPKPLPQIQPQQSSSQLLKSSSPATDQTDPTSDSISLRPLGRTGSSSSSSLPIIITPDHNKEKESTISSICSPKPEPFVPPHLRPGFVGKEDRLGQDGQKNLGFRSRELAQKQGHHHTHQYQQQQQQQQQVGSSIRFGEDGRPKSGGYETIHRGGNSDQEFMNRPNSSGNHRPNSRGWYGSSNRSPHHF